MAHKYKVIKNDASQKYIGHVQMTDTISKERAVKTLSEKLGVSYVKINSVLRGVGEALKQIANEACQSRLGNFGLARIFALGGAEGPNGPWDVDKNKLRLAVVDSSAMKAALQTIIPTPIQGDVVPTIASILNIASGNYDEIFPGTMVQIVGDDLSIDTSTEDEGVWLEYDGNKYSLLLDPSDENDIQTIFAALPSSTPAPTKMAQAKIIVKTRCGLSSSAPLQTVSRNIMFGTRT